MIDLVVTRPSLAEALGFTERTISQGQYWERRRQLGVLPFLFFFLALVGQLIRLGVITGIALIVNASLLSAWREAGLGARWQKYAGRPAVFGYIVHTVLCSQSDLPVFLLLTPAHPHDSQVGWFVVLVAALLLLFSVQVVYADAAFLIGACSQTSMTYSMPTRRSTTTFAAKASAKSPPCSSWNNGTVW